MNAAEPLRIVEVRESPLDDRVIICEKPDPLRQFSVFSEFSPIDPFLVLQRPIAVVVAVEFVRTCLRVLGTPADRRPAPTGKELRPCLVPH